MQRHFGISADEALYERPAWELDNLLECLEHEMKQRETEDG